MIAFTFPGQGSQRPGAGDPWRTSPSWEVVEAASDAARRDIGHLLLEAGADELKATDNAQLSTYVISLVVLDAVRRLGLEAAYVAGHSLGEYTALTAAGVLSLADGVRLVAERGDAMRAATQATEGTMAAVLGADDDAVEQACARARQARHDVWVANFNAPGQVVIAGSPAGVDHASALAKELGAKRAMPVAVSGAFHTPYMAPAQARLDAAIAAARFGATAEVPVAANVDGEVHGDGEAWPRLLSAQLCAPVRWSQVLRTLSARGVRTFVELGPGTVLSGLAKRGTEGTSAAAATPDQAAELVESLGGAAPRPVEGETLFAAERLLVSTTAGVFAPSTSLRDGVTIAIGDEVGRVGDQVVTSRFSGRLMGMLAWHGERVAPSQPLAWLRTS